MTRSATSLLELSAGGAAVTSTALSSDENDKEGSNDSIFYPNKKKILKSTLYRNFDNAYDDDDDDDNCNSDDDSTEQFACESSVSTSSSKPGNLLMDLFGLDPTNNGLMGDDDDDDIDSDLEDDVAFILQATETLTTKKEEQEVEDDVSAAHTAAEQLSHCCATSTAGATFMTAAEGTGDDEVDEAALISMMDALPDVTGETRARMRRMQLEQRREKLQKRAATIKAGFSSLVNHVGKTVTTNKTIKNAPRETKCPDTTKLPDHAASQVVPIDPENEEIVHCPIHYNLEYRDHDVESYDGIFALLRIVAILAQDENEQQQFPREHTSHEKNDPEGADDGEPFVMQNVTASTRQYVVKANSRKQLQQRSNNEEMSEITSPVSSINSGEALCSVSDSNHHDERNNQDHSYYEQDQEEPFVMQNVTALTRKYVNPTSRPQSNKSLRLGNLSASLRSLPVFQQQKQQQTLSDLPMTPFLSDEDNEINVHDTDDGDGHSITADDVFRGPSSNDDDDDDDTCQNSSIHLLQNCTELTRQRIITEAGNSFAVLSPPSLLLFRATSAPAGSLESKQGEDDDHDGDEPFVMQNVTELTRQRIPDELCRASSLHSRRSSLGSILPFSSSHDKETTERGTRRSSNILPFSSSHDKETTEREINHDNGDKTEDDFGGRLYGFSPRRVNRKRNLMSQLFQSMNASSSHQVITDVSDHSSSEFPEFMTLSTLDTILDFDQDGNHHYEEDQVLPLGTFDHLYHQQVQSQTPLDIVERHFFDDDEPLTALCNVTETTRQFNTEEKFQIQLMM